MDADEICILLEKRCDIYVYEKFITSASPDLGIKRQTLISTRNMALNK